MTFLNGLNIYNSFNIVTEYVIMYSMRTIQTYSTDAASKHQGISEE